MTRGPHPRVPRLWLGSVFAVVLGLYWYTLCPTVHWDDSGELIAAAYVLGIPHPPGEPLYTLLGWVFTHLPGLPSPAYGMNLMSAVFGAATWTLVGGWLWQIQRRHGASARFATAVASLASLTGAAGQITWYQSVIAENTTLHTTFIAGLVWWAWRLGTGPRLADGPLLRRMLAWACVFGLSATNHPAGVFLFPALAAWFIATQGARMLRPHWVLAMLAAAGVGLLPYAYLVLASRADPALDWGNPETWDNFVWVVTARQYEANAFRGPSLVFLQRGSWNLLRAIAGEWGAWGALAGAVGWVRLVRVDKPLALWPLPVLVVFVYLSANPAYIGAYLVPAFLFLLPAVAEALAWGGRLLTARVRTAPALAAGLGMLLPMGTVGAHWEQNDLRRDDLAERYGRYVLGSLPPNAILVSESAHLYFVGLYLTLCEGYRPDVVLVSANGLTRPGYLDTLRRQRPDLAWPETFAPADDLDTAAQLRATPFSYSPPWTRDLLLAVYDANAARHRMYWENVSPYEPILDQFAQAGYVFELRRPLSSGARAAHAAEAGPIPPLAVPPPWDARVWDSAGARTAYASAVSVVANAWSMSGRHRAAVQAFSLCQRLDPRNPSFQANQGIALAHLGRNDAAEAALTFAVRAQPETGLHAANLAHFYRENGRDAEALPWMRHALAHWPNAPWDFLMRAAELEMAAGEPDRALAALKRARELQPEHPTTAHNLATVALRLHRLDDAEPAVRTGLRVAPGSAYSWFLGAWLAAERRADPGEIQRLLAGARDRDHGATVRLAAAHPGLGQALAEMGTAPAGSVGTDESR